MEIQAERNKRAPRRWAPEQDMRASCLEQVAGRMREASQGLSLALSATVDAPATARNAVAEYAAQAGASPAQLDAVRTVVSEAVTNVVRHAYRADEPDRPLHVYASVVGAELTILVADAGRGPRVASPDPGLGLGWRLISQLAEQWTVIQRGTGGTMVSLRIRLADSRA